MKLESSVFKDGGDIPKLYTCDENDVNPPLKISDVPREARSLALIMDDPDAPMGTWVHWVLWNIDPKISEIREKGIPAGAEEGLTSFGRPGYGGPCPPSGNHRYFFRLYALDMRLILAPGSGKGELEAAMKDHVIEETTLMGRYGRAERL